MTAQLQHFETPRSLSDMSQDEKNQYFAAQIMHLMRDVIEARSEIAHYKNFINNELADLQFDMQQMKREDAKLHKATPVLKDSPPLPKIFDPHLIT
jgi:hypothetical protein